MSCLMLSELPISEQVAIQLAHAARLSAVAADVLTVLDSPVQKATSLAPLPLGAGESDSIPHAEQTAMVEESCKFVPIRPCACKRHARIYKASGNCTVRYFAECSACSIRTGRVSDMAEAADQWNAGSAAPFGIHRNDAVAA